LFLYGSLEEENLAQRLTDDPHRPLYHFLPPANWMNDPNGLIQWQGQYHLFYQYNPDGPCWGAMHWGHAVSKDVVHWTHLPIALAPTPGGPDEDGCWSGCAVDDHGVPTLVYTGVMPQVQCVATSTDDLITWEKHSQNPVIAAPPEGLQVTGFRDPCVWRQDDVWYAIIGSGIQDVGGTALLYQSDDLIDWQYMHPIHVGDKDETGEMWECPDLFPLGGRRYVLLVGAHPEFLYTYYFVGSYTDHKFAPQTLSKIDFGGYFYAAQTLLDDKRRRIMWGWIKEGRTDEALKAAGWAGVMSLPRVLTLRPDGLLDIEPVSELKTLRGRHHRLADVDLTPTSSCMLKDVRGDCLEVIAEFEPGDAAEFGLQVRCSPDGTEQTRIFYDRAAGCLIVDREQSSLSPNVHRGVQEGTLDLPPDEELELHVFLDRSVIEIYANGHFCLTSRIYPSRNDSLGVGLFACGGSVKLKALDVWQMAPMRMGEIYASDPD
jgi:beta-fructofuranosidase